MKRSVLIVSAFMMAAFFANGQNGHLKGLQSDEKYLALTEKEGVLSRAEDSLVRVMNAHAEKMRTERPKRADGDLMMALENELYEVRNNLGLVMSDIASIEQEYILNNLNGPSKRGNPNLVYNDVFSENLSPEDLASLRKAQQKELIIVGQIRDYLNNYVELKALKAVYDTVALASSGDSLRNVFMEDHSRNTYIERAIGEQWAEVFDNKSFAYIYLLDRLNKNSELSAFENEMRMAQEKKIAKKGEFESDVLSGYVIDKKLLLGIEANLAHIMELSESADSLAKESQDIASLNLDLPRLDFEERVFIKYEDAGAVTPARYNAKNLVPEIERYSKGVVYRILLGSYQKAQLPSLFKNVAPLAYELSGGRYNYYAGDYPTYDDAENGVAKMKSLGFRAPEIVMFTPDETRNITKTATQEQKAGIRLRIEISGAEALPEGVRDLITDSADKKDIARMTDSDGKPLFTVSSFASRVEAEKLVSALNSIDDSLNVKIVEITE